jgi:hypothetical protein
MLYVDVWVQYVFNEQGTRDCAEKTKLEGVKYFFVHVNYCMLKDGSVMSRELQTMAHDKDGNLLYNNSSYDSKWTGVRPGSNDEIIFKKSLQYLAMNKIPLSKN